MKLKKLLMIGAVACSWSSIVPLAHADLYTDVDYHFDILGPGEDATGVFNIVTGDGDFGDIPGYNPATEIISSALATFSFVDLNWFSTSTVTVDLGGASFLSASSWVLPILLSDQLTGNILLDLRSDGEIQYSVENTGGDYVKFVGALLIAKSSHCVPDGGSTALMLGGLLGFAALVLRIQKRKGIRAP